MQTIAYTITMSIRTIAGRRRETEFQHRKFE
jgi:hypothetical protein